MAPWKNNRAALYLPAPLPADTIGSLRPLCDPIYPPRNIDQLSIADKTILGAKEFPFGRHTLSQMAVACRHPASSSEDLSDPDHFAPTSDQRTLLQLRNIRRISLCARANGLEVLFQGLSGENTTEIPGSGNLTWTICYAIKSMSRYLSRKRNFGNASPRMVRIVSSFDNKIGKL